ncbi:MAG: YdcF family protein [Rhodanobacter sp.]
MPSNSPESPGLWRYLRDRDVLITLLITLLVLILSFGLVWLGYLIHVWRVAARSALAPPQRMVVLVFGRRLERGAPGHDYLQRLQRSLTLARAGQVEQLWLLGGCSEGQLSEAAAGLAWLRQQGLPAQVSVELEQESVDSLGNLRHARCLLQAKYAHLPSVALVTSRYHLARCRLLASRLGFDGLPVAAEAALSLQPRYLGRLLMEASYLMWIDIGTRWGRLIGNQRIAAWMS